MSQISTPDGAAAYRDDVGVGGGGAPGSLDAASPTQAGRRRAAPIVGGSILCVVALVFLAGAGWALWADRVDRDSDGFVSFGTSELQTDQYAIVGDLKGDGPDWLYGSNVIGDSRVRATSQTEQPLFVGIAPKDDVFRYLQGAGYATVEGFEVSADTTHPGGAPSDPPEDASIWAKSTQGTGEQTLTWTPRDGDWSVVMMNADATGDVDVRGDASAELPFLPWLAVACLIIGGAVAFAGVSVLVRAVRRGGQRTDVSHTSSATQRPAGAHT